MAKGELIEIGLVLFPGAQLSAVLGLGDLFELANRTAVRKQGDAPPNELRVSHWRAETSQDAPLRVFDTHPGRPGMPAVYVAPPALGDPITPKLAAPIAGWMRERHAAGGVLASICAGAFVLGETGLLAGRVVTTNWAMTRPFARVFLRSGSTQTGCSSMTET